MIHFDKLITLAGKPLSTNRNSVSLLYAYGELCVRKEHDTPPAADRERLNLLMLRRSGLYVPEPLFFSSPFLFMTFADGHTYAQLLSKWESGAFSRSHIVPACTALCNWLFSFHELTGKAVGDLDLANFIYTPAQHCVGVDFEDEFREEKAEQAIASLLALVTTARPSFSPLKKQIFLFILYISYRKGLKLIEIKNSYFSEIERMSLQRAFHKNEAQKAYDFFARLTEL
jgi:hypothetical protein